uniref:Uncharacterized protein n=1 Tax=Arundo donax TaxID=35708 RepID=A0A0A9BYV1_ARUDO
MRRRRGRPSARCACPSSPPVTPSACSPSAATHSTRRASTRGSARAPRAPYAAPNSTRHRPITENTEVATSRSWSTWEAAQRLPIRRRHLRRAKAMMAHNCREFTGDMHRLVDRRRACCAASSTYFGVFRFRG